jgi:23S rRNA pseudouridine1911/1915/1917 synthase
MDAISDQDESDAIAIEVGDAEAGVRIDRFLGQRFYPAVSRSFLTDLVIAGTLKVNGQAVRPAYRVKPGDLIAGPLVAQTEASPQPEAIALDVAYEDDQILMVRKPAGMVVHPGPGCPRGTLVNALLHRNPELAQVGVVSRPGIVHRLDANTSGIMIVARTNEARLRLVAQFKEKQVRKEYRAVVVGVMTFDSDYIDLPIGEDRDRQDRMRIDEVDGKASSTFYEVIERLAGVTYVKAMPFTGRTHQIRVHLAHLGHPVFADPMYGKRYSQKFDQERQARLAAGLPPLIARHALHAFKVRFEHPSTGEQVEFEAPLPPDFEALLAHFRGLSQ